MPNWVTNWLTIRKQDKNLVLNADEKVDFNILIPMPEELNNTISGGDIKDCMAYYFLKTHTKKEFVNSDYFSRNYALLKPRMTKKEMLEKLEERTDENPRMFDSELYGGEHKHTREEVGKYYVDLVEKYGTYDWYGWSISNWGCKWNARSSQICDESDDYLCLQFDTPWGCPDAWLEELANKIPYHLAWEEEQGYRGIVTSQGNGYDIDEELPMIEWEEDEDGCLEQTEDEYGDNWFDLYMDTVFSKGA